MSYQKKINVPQHFFMDKSFSALSHYRNILSFAEEIVLNLGLLFPVSFQLFEFEYVIIVHFKKHEWECAVFSNIAVWALEILLG